MVTAGFPGGGRFSAMPARVRDLAVTRGDSIYGEPGARREVYPLIINRDSPTTDDRAVDVYIYGAWSEMRLRNNRGAWSDWRPFASSFTWTLGEGSGAALAALLLRAACALHNEMATFDEAGVPTA